MRRTGARSASVRLRTPARQRATTAESSGRWLKGARFSKDAQAGEGPALSIAVLALKGEAELRGSKGQVTLKAPPGPALLIGDFNAESVLAPQYLEKLPPWAGQEAVTEQGKRLQLALLKMRQLWQTKSPADAAEELARSDDEAERRLGINALAAMDELARLALVLSTTKHPDVWDAGVLAYATEKW